MNDEKLFVLGQQLTYTQYLAYLRLATSYRDENGINTWNEKSDAFKIGCIKILTMILDANGAERPLKRYAKKQNNHNSRGQ